MNVGVARVPVAKLIEELAKEFDGSLGVNDKKKELEQRKLIKEMHAKLLKRFCKKCGKILNNDQKKYCSRKCVNVDVKKGRCGQLCRLASQHRYAKKKRGKVV